MCSIAFAFAEELDPSTERRQRSPELVCRLSRHSGPDLLAIRALTGAKRVDAGEQQQGERSRLHQRDDTQPVHERGVADVQRSYPALGQRRILSVQLRDVLAHLRVRTRSRIIDAPIEGRVRRGSDVAVGVREQHRYPGLADLPGQLEKHTRRVLRRRRQRLVHARVHAAGPFRFTPKLEDDALRVQDVRSEEQNDSNGDDEYRRAAAHGSADGVGAEIRP
jgi:hypothetical protein